jgi:hypothetical protein
MRIIDPEHPYNWQYCSLIYIDESIGISKYIYIGKILSVFIFSKLPNTPSYTLSAATSIMSPRRSLFAIASAVLRARDPGPSNPLP